MDNYFSTLQDQLFIPNNFGTYKSSHAWETGFEKENPQTHCKLVKSQCLDLCVVDLLRLPMQICTDCMNLLCPASICVLPQFACFFNLHIASICLMPQFTCYLDLHDSSICVQQVLPYSLLSKLITHCE
jgi:hypothetical protein